MGSMDDEVYNYHAWHSCVRTASIQSSMLRLTTSAVVISNNVCNSGDITTNLRYDINVIASIVGMSCHSHMSFDVPWSSHNMVELYVCVDVCKCYRTTDAVLDALLCHGCDRVLPEVLVWRFACEWLWWCAHEWTQHGTLIDMIIVHTLAQVGLG